MRACTNKQKGLCKENIVKLKDNFLELPIPRDQRICNSAKGFYLVVVPNRDPLNCQLCKEEI